MARRGLQGAMMRGFGARDHEVTVTGTEWLAPAFLRVRMSSRTLLADAAVGPASWLRFWFPDPDDPELEQQRGYTLSEVDVDTGSFAVDFVIHEPSGPASAWALRAEPGMTLSANSLGAASFTVPEELPAGYLLIGDSASIPAINGILRVVTAELPVEVLLEEHGPDDRLIPLAEHPRLRLRWVPRQGETSLAAAIEARDWSDW